MEQKSAQHYDILDGLRGIAAVAVMIFHLRNVVGRDIPVFAHGYLAVDFFFCLSGFVVAHAYDGRMRRGMTARAFFLRRVIRLHPLIVAGTLCGMVLYCWAPFRATGWTSGGWQFVMTLSLALLTLPYPTVPGRGILTHSLNGPIWILQQEYVANIVYVIGLNRLALPVLSWIAAGCAALTLTCALVYNGLEVGAGYDGNWMANVRVAYPFVTGIVLARSFAAKKPRCIGFLSLATLVLIVLGSPQVTPATEVGIGPVNGLYDAAVVLLIFPVIVALGAHSNASPLMLGACRLLGRLSYPVYVLQQPVIDVFADYVHHTHVSRSTQVMQAAALAIAIIVFSFAMERLWDAPVRKWLTTRFAGRGAHVRLAYA